MVFLASFDSCISRSIERAGKWVARLDPWIPVFQSHPADNCRNYVVGAFSSQHVRTAHAELEFNAVDILTFFKLVQVKPGSEGGLV